MSEDSKDNLIQLTDDFLSHEIITDLKERAGVRCAWDFNSALGDTIMEKYESLYVKLVEINNVLIHKGAKGFFWIAAGPEVASIFETATAGFAPALSSFGDQVPLGMTNVYAIGTINRRWKIYCDPAIDSNLLIMGVGMEKEPDCNYAALRIANFVI